jgi:hypothetical protein
MKGGAMTSQTRIKLVRLIAEVERLTNKSKGGEHACQFCDSRGQVDVDHAAQCPLGKLWELMH